MLKNVLTRLIFLLMIVGVIGMPMVCFISNNLLKVCLLLLCFVCLWGGLFLLVWHLKKQGSCNMSKKQFSSMRFMCYISFLCLLLNGVELPSKLHILVLGIMTSSCVIKGLNIIHQINNIKKYY